MPKKPNFSTIIKKIKIPPIYIYIYKVGNYLMEGINGDFLGGGFIVTPVDIDGDIRQISGLSFVNLDKPGAMVGPLAVEKPDVGGDVEAPAQSLD